MLLLLKQVGQGSISSIVSSARALLASIALMYQEKPSLLLCNGPGTCVPVCVAAKLLIPVMKCRVVFIESIARVESLSLSGKLLLYLRLADAVCVQWQKLTMQHPGVIYVSHII